MYISGRGRDQSGRVGILARWGKEGIAKEGIVEEGGFEGEVNESVEEVPDVEDAELGGGGFWEESGRGEVGS